jgi:threonine dehydratase
MGTAGTGTVPTLRDLELARARIEGIAKVTPVQTSETFSRLSGREVVLKAENLQRTGSFKVRGAVNTIASLGDAERASGVVAATAGNHGQAVAWAARGAGIGATVFMPRDTPMAKVDATRAYGATIESSVASLEEAFEAAVEFAQSTGATFVHAFEDERIIAGQGTLGLELAEQAPSAETVVVPVGGGGLGAGIALALGALRPHVRLVGVQAESCAPLAGRRDHSFTIAEGIAVKRPGELTSSILRDRFEGIVTVSDDEISQAILLLAERTKLVVEGAGAVGVAALLNGRIDGTGPVCVVLSGGNIDASLLIQVMRHGLTRAGRYLVVRTQIPDRPGELIKLLQLVAEERVNVVSVEHHREGMAISVGETEVELTLGTRDVEHCAALLAAMRRWGYPVESLS